jgi:hypothetical protein
VEARAAALAVRRSEVGRIIRCSSGECA